MAMALTASFAVGTDGYPDFYRTDYQGLSDQPQPVQVYGQQGYDQPTQQIQGQSQGYSNLAGYGVDQTAGVMKFTAVQQMPDGVQQIQSPAYPGLLRFVAGQEIDTADRFAKMRIVSGEFDPNLFPGEPVFVSWEGSDMINLGISRYFSMARMPSPGKIAKFPEVKMYIEAEAGLLPKITSLKGGIDPLWPVVQIPGTPLRAALALGPIVEILEYKYVPGQAHLVSSGTSGELVTYLVTIIGPDDNELAKFLMTWSGDKPMLLLAPPNTPRK